MKKAIKILIVDDEPAMRHLTRILLSDLVSYVPIIFFEAETGEDALIHIRQRQTEHPDVIVLDMNMPRMNGYEFLKEYKRAGLSDSKNTKIYIHSTSLTESMRNKISELGVVRNFIEKEMGDVLIRQLLVDFGFIENPMLNS